jgi:hypothetical protein
MIEVEEHGIALWGTACGHAPCTNVPLNGATGTIDPRISPIRPVCAGNTIPVPTKVLFARVARPRGHWEVEMRIPSLGVVMDVANDDRGIYCAGFAARPRSFDIGCVGAGDQAVHFGVSNGAIHSTNRSRAPFDDDTTVGPAIMLPCGAVVGWQEFEAWDPAPLRGVGTWTGPPYDACNCDVARLRCEHRCDDQWADDDGNLPPDDMECRARCLREIVCPCTGRRWSPR